MDKLEDILLKITNLLNNNDEKDAAKSFEKLHKEAISYCGDYDVDFLIKIKSLYGGMGSFNDLVLHKNSKPLIDENNVLDNLRDQLYEKCKELRLAKHQGNIIDF